jgi:hypothetical protein
VKTKEQLRITARRKPSDFRLIPTPLSTAASPQIPHIPTSRHHGTTAAIAQTTGKKFPPAKQNDSTGSTRATLLTSQTSQYEGFFPHTNKSGATQCQHRIPNNPMLPTTEKDKG